jgi:hypothetical protein
VTCRVDALVDQRIQAAALETVQSTCSQSVEGTGKRWSVTHVLALFCSYVLSRTVLWVASLRGEQETFFGATSAGERRLRNGAERLEACKRTCVGSGW